MFGVQLGKKLSLGFVGTSKLPGEWDTQEMLTKPAHSQIAEQDGITLLFIVDTSKTICPLFWQGWKTNPPGLVAARTISGGTLGTLTCITTAAFRPTMDAAADAMDGCGNPEMEQIWWAQPFQVQRTKLGADTRKLVEEDTALPQMQKKCAACGSAEEGQKCRGKCGLVTYCSKKCQMQHWKKGHLRNTGTKNISGAARVRATRPAFHVLETANSLPSFYVAARHVPM